MAQPEDTAERDVTLYRKLVPVVKTAFASAGLRIEQDFVVRDPMRHFVAKAHELGIGSVIDVGANAGQFAQELRAAGYGRQIYSFEPLAAAHAACTAASLGDARWQVMPAMALGERSGTAQINVSHNLVSSSLMPIKSASVSAAPESAVTTTETIAIARLDDVVTPEWQRPLALKTDTQGFELAVLRGATASLADVALLQLEMSLVELYEGAPDFCTLYQAVEKMGFRCIGITQGFADHVRQELLQVDGLFVRQD